MAVRKDGVGDIMDLASVMPSDISQTETDKNRVTYSHGDVNQEATNERTHRHSPQHGGHQREDEEGNGGHVRGDGRRLDSGGGCTQHHRHVAK